MCTVKLEVVSKCGARFTAVEAMKQSKICRPPSVTTNLGYASSNFSYNNKNGN
jgi:hypothetical protein